MTLADFIAPGTHDARLHFPEEATATDYGTLWNEAEAMGSLRASVDGSPVAIALTNTRACLTALVGAIAAGQPLVSVPLPPRGADTNWYSQFVERICRLSGASRLLVDTSLGSTLPPMDSVMVQSFEDVLTERGRRVFDPGSFSFTQFTSGSTADPKGAVLSGAKIVANLRALLEWLQPRPGDGTCTWLPLSHDMGLIGMVLCTLAGIGDAWAGGGHLVLLSPRGFVRNPASWLAACEEFGSTVTAAPNFGYDMAVLRTGRMHDLRRLRACIVGAEPIRAGTLERFARVTQDSGFDATALCPAYGMAEAALAVTSTPPGVHWSAAEFQQIADDPLGKTGIPASHQVVSCGPPLPGYEVRIDGVGIGEILVKGPSVAASYADGRPVADANGWFHTRDLGVIRDGQLYVLGRTDDVFFVAGRNVYALDVEAYAAEVQGVRNGRVVAVPDQGALTLVAECEATYRDQPNARRLAIALRERIVARLGVAPRRVLLAQRGALPLTASGKIRRKSLMAALESSQLKVLAGSLE